ncbi:MAG: ABC transporter permease [Anaerolineae bacterium]|nr:ABC transporter permease [Anaerolineae bacterium]
MTSRQRRQIFDAVLIPILAIITGLAFSSVFVLMTSTPPLVAYQEMFKAGFGCERLDNCSFFLTLERATPLILTGLSAVVAFRSGLFSIGQEGQFLLGALMAAWIGYAIQLPPVIHSLVILAIAMAIGAAYAFIPAILKLRLNVNEIISTIILNSIAALFVTYMVNFPLRANRSSTASTPIIHASAELPSFFPGSHWGVGFLIAVAATIFVWFFLWRTVPGYEQRMSGQAPFFARFGGIRSERAAIRGMLISGALAGLAGAIEVLGVNRQIVAGFSSGLGFDGVLVAILGQAHPLGVFLVAILFAGIRLGSQIGLQITTNIPRELGGGILALIILFVSARSLFGDVINLFRNSFGTGRGIPKEDKA